MVNARRVHSVLSRYAAPIFATLAFLLAGFIYFANLNTPSIRHDDEAFHSMVVQRMVDTGQWFPPPGKNFNQRKEERKEEGKGGIYLNKPPLKMWLSASVVSFFGKLNWQFRFIDAAAGLATSALIFIAGTALTTTKWGGILAMLIFLAAPGPTFHHCFRHGVQDGMLVLLATASLLAFVKNRPYLTGILVGCAVLTKHIAGVIPLVIIGTATVLGSFPERGVALKNLLICCLLAILISAAFYGPIAYYYPDALVSFFNREIVERAGKGLHNRGQPWYYLDQLLFQRSAVPREVLALAFLSFLLIYSRLRKSVRDKKILLFLFLWSVVPVILFSLGNSKLPWYIFPAYPGMALLSAFVLTRTSQEFPKIAPVICILLVCFLGRPLYKIATSVASPGIRTKLDLQVEELKSIPVVICGKVKLNPSELFYLAKLDPNLKRIKKCNPEDFDKPGLLLVTPEKDKKRFKIQRS